MPMKKTGMASAILFGNGSRRASAIQRRKGLLIRFRSATSVMEFTPSAYKCLAIKGIHPKITALKMIYA